MLDWDLSYDYTALLLFGLVLLWHMIEKKIPLERYYVFAIFTFIGFFAMNPIKLGKFNPSSLFNPNKWHTEYGEEYLYEKL